MVPTGSTSVMPRLSQRLMLMLTTPVSMVPTGDTLPTHTLMDTLAMLPHTHMATLAMLPHTTAPTVVSTSVMPRLSQRLMLTTPDTTDTDTHLTDTAHTDTAIPHTGATDMVAVTLMADTTTKLLFKV